VANFAPALLQRLARAVQSGDRDQALAVQRQVTDLATVFDQGYWLAAMKTVLLEMGIGNGRLVAPFPACTPEQHRRIRQILQAQGLIGKEERNG
jgi:dihydrodipicolinate synthase/N-acetylneuraminate lyase